jgi:phosphatidylserine/phosphatidylglycerophosphate/cardiolipin synthase-like enzyme
VEKFVNRGVDVFTRRYLHSKLVVGDRFAMVGSANVSIRSRDLLDEAAVLTNDAVVIRRAKDFIDRLCTEPVRPEYLKECKLAYKPPRIGGVKQQLAAQERVRHAKLWIVPLQLGFSIPESELPRYERGAAKAKKLVAEVDMSRVENFFWPYRPQMADELDRGDWIIQATKQFDGSIRVQPPAQLLLIDSYVRDKQTGKERYVFHVEIPKGGHAMSWSAFRKRAKGVLGSELARRTKAVRDGDQADALLRLWTARGRLARS